jgi:hypothetical protein
MSSTRRSTDWPTHTREVTEFLLETVSSAAASNKAKDLFSYAPNDYYTAGSSTGALGWGCGVAAHACHCLVSWSACVSFGNGAAVYVLSFLLPLVRVHGLLTRLNPDRTPPHPHTHPHNRARLHGAEGRPPQAAGQGQMVRRLQITSSPTSLCLVSGNVYMLLVRR